MPGYSNPNASSTVDYYPSGNVDLTAGDPTTTNVFTIGTPAAYGVNTSAFRVSLVTDIGGGITPTANCKIRVNVNGNLKDEKTYTAAETNPEFTFDCVAGDQVEVIYSTNAAGAEEVTLNAARWIIRAIAA